MKMNSKVYAALQEALAPLDTAQRRETYAIGDYPRAAGVKDLDTRYRWDLFYMAGGFRLLDEQPDLTQSHIDTALRRMIAPIVPHR
jgi:hypothetical protein